jgi:uncharacterized protein (DUF433 family)
MVSMAGVKQTRRGVGNAARQRDAAGRNSVMAYITRDAARDARATTRFRNSAARAGRVSSLGVDFETFAATLRRSVVPASPLESVLTDRIILAAWRLQLASALDFETAAAGEDLPPVARETLDAEVSLDRTLELLEASRADRLSRDNRATSAPADLLDEADYSNEWITLPDDARSSFSVDEDDYDYIDDTDDDDDDRTFVTPRWNDRLEFDANVSETSPVVKGTWVTVGHVVSMIVDGYTWTDILRTHPELTEDDVRTCLAYSAEQDSNDDY